MQVQVDLVLVDGAVQLGIEDHGRRADVVLAGIVVVALVVGVVVVGGDRHRCGRPRRPGAVMVAWAAATCATASENVRVAGLAGHQGQGRRRRPVSWVHGHAVRRVGVLLALRWKNCKIDIGTCSTVSDSQLDAS